MRISAENMYGISDPLESEEMRAKDLFSMFCIHTYFTRYQQYFIYHIIGNIVIYRNAKNEIN